MAQLVRAGSDGCREVGVWPSQQEGEEERERMGEMLLPVEG